MRYLVIYNDGNAIVKENRDTAFALPGEYLVFSFDKTNEVNDLNGICYYDKGGTQTKFILERFELIHIDILNNQLSRFSFFDHKSGGVVKISANSNYLPQSLPMVIQEIKKASLLPNWETYELLQSIDRLKTEKETLQKQLNEAKQEINMYKERENKK